MRATSNSITKNSPSGNDYNPPVKVLLLAVLLAAPSAAAVRHALSTDGALDFPLPSDGIDETSTSGKYLELKTDTGRLNITPYENANGTPKEMLDAWIEKLGKRSDCTLQTRPGPWPLSNGWTAFGATLRCRLGPDQPAVENQVVVFAAGGRLYSALGIGIPALEFLRLLGDASAKPARGFPRIPMPPAHLVWPLLVIFALTAWVFFFWRRALRVRGLAFEAAQRLKDGEDPEAVRRDLLSAGYSLTEVGAALREAQEDRL